MPTLLYRGHSLVKGTGFDAWRPIGMPVPAIRVYNTREVDELVFLDISATSEGRGPDFNLIEDLANNCFMPFAVGGGVKSIADIRQLLRVGADKVVINTAAIENPSFVTDAKNIFGSQCIVVSIDVKRLKDGRYEVYTRSGSNPTGINPLNHAINMQASGAGEILLTAIERDGTMEGYDIELISQISSVIKIPIVASGGAGSCEDMALALSQEGVTAVAAASLFHFTETTPKEAKKFLRDRGFPIRK